ncbi:MAG TPA: TAXI family TRAP transporter solute-binding subunit [Hyphomicrobiaceae bacterium]|nr:TAXI family TRAP transporter solute-binding subunit [Hyphomicrobiaceae bacterium]
MWFPHSRLQLREILLIGGPAAVLVLAAFWLAYQFVQPAPPNQIFITTGSPTGAYYAFANRYRAELAKSGITLDVLTSKGSVENLARLSDDEKRVDLALMQGGIADERSAPNLISYGRVFLEPVWIFHRLDASIDRLSALKGMRIAIGPQGSGTRKLAADLLRATGIDETNTKLLALGSDAAVEALGKGEVDAAFFTLAPESPLLNTLMLDSSLKLLNLKRAEAYTRRFPYLSHVVLPEGAIDLARNLPSSNINMLAAQAALVARKDLHPALAWPLVDALKATHSAGGMFQRVGQFPQGIDPEYPMSEDAQRMYTSGTPFFQRFLPFWLASLIERMIIMVVPVATILLPLFKLGPMIYEWRIRSRLLYWYAQLKAMEKRLGEGMTTTASGTDLSAEIDRIDEAVSTIPVPLHYSDRLYELRAAIELVRQRIAART